MSIRLDSGTAWRRLSGMPYSRMLQPSGIPDKTVCLCPAAERPSDSRTPLPRTILPGPWRTRRLHHLPKTSVCLRGEARKIRGGSHCTFDVLRRVWRGPALPEQVPVKVVHEDCGRRVLRSPPPRRPGRPRPRRLRRSAECTRCDRQWPPVAGTATPQTLLTSQLTKVLAGLLAGYPVTSSARWASELLR